VLRTLRAHQAVEADGDLPLPLVVGVPVDQRGLRGGLARTNHRVPERGARAGRERVSGVTKVEERKPSGSPATARARRHFQAKEVRRNGTLFSATNSSPSGPFSAYQARCRFTSLWRNAGRTTVRTPRRTWTRQEPACRWSAPARHSYADHQAVEVDVPAAKTGEFLGSRRAIHAEVDHEAPADTDRSARASTWATVAISVPAPAAV
jgi:hypothetical protein